jgi:DNA invertase Pin-like site-specific DNA recombinase
MPLPDKPEFKAPTSLGELLAPIENILGGLRSGETWAVYSRVSVFDPRNPGYSMETQPDHAEDYARSHGAQNILTYADPDCTGKNSKRQGLQEMLRDIKAGKVDVVVIHRLDRLYRNLESLLEFTHLLKKYKVKLVSVTEQIDTTTWWGRLVLAVLGHMAESYLHQTSGNTRTGLDARRRNGLHLGHLPLGYCNGLCTTCTDANGQGYCPLFGGPDRPESQRGKLAVPHPIDQYVIPLIFDLYLQGFSHREIAAYLNTTQIPLPDGSQVRFRPRKTLESTHESA